ncbi:hypothetical protein PCC7424_4430 [Gloeothece citriformis PCC 7424]|uniref:CopG domain protein DNA-binding domain protein n=1 Tax=Gloeothece citriformis (strain PCC 7424) TaxID=65393 RepID=B7K925_GLOC7|nr:hypothetical protein [Gloeothece citriformis]ACK72794.1 hypothetical protein PCC7424_4430 [Gloeothece citriformis PCC 7424]
MSELNPTISLTSSLYEQVTALAKQLQIPPTQVVMLAVEEYLRHYQDYQAKQLMNSWNEAYSDGLDESETLTLEAMRRHQGQLP